MDKRLDEEALEKLLDYHWPGNIRELKNVVERAIILSGESAWIHAEHITLGSPANGQARHGRTRSGQAAEIRMAFDKPPTLEDLEKKYLGLLLERFDGHRGKVARAMGVSERNVYRLLKKHEFVEV
ncbi:MAG: helix-turn-helix domain-containing protein [Thiolinea sp.]